MYRDSRLFEQGGDALDSADELVLLKEMSHRVCNEYAFLVSAISLRASKSSSRAVKLKLAEITDLVMQAADVHRALACPDQSQPTEVCSYLRRLCAVVSGARLADRRIRLLLLETDPLYLSADRCWKLGLTISELISNSVKHAFNGGDGLIRIELGRSGTLLTCCVRDNGKQRTSSRPGQGMGLMHSLIQSAGGTIDFAFGDKGAVSMISMPQTDSGFELTL